MCVVTDATLTHLLESEQYVQTARGEIDLEAIQQVANTSVLGLRSRTTLEGK